MFSQVTRAAKSADPLWGSEGVRTELCNLNLPLPLPLWARKTLSGGGGPLPRNGGGQLCAPLSLSSTSSVKNHCVLWGRIHSAEFLSCPRSARDNMKTTKTAGGLLPETSRAFGFYHVDVLKRLQAPSRSVLGPFGPPRKTTKNDGGFAPEP